MLECASESEDKLANAQCDFSSLIQGSRHNPSSALPANTTGLIIKPRGRANLVVALQRAANIRLLSTAAKVR